MTLIGLAKVRLPPYIANYRHFQAKQNPPPKFSTLLIKPYL